MLYDNAQLLELLALAHARTSKDLFRRRARETVDWLVREMLTADGAFAASLDADSEGEEGKFYVWSLQEITAVLGTDETAFFARHYDVTADGNFEGHNILNRLERVPTSEAEESHLTRLRATLLPARSQRVRPGLDDKVLADWNGLMITALVNAGTILDEPDWLDRAKRAFAFVVREMTRDDRLGHSWRSGRLLYPGLASDFAAMTRAALALYEASGDRAYLDHALAWQRALERHYANAESGGYFLTADDAGGLVIRPQSTLDEAIPNPNGLIAQNLVRLAMLAGDDQWRQRTDHLFDGLLPLAAENLFSHVSLLNALDLRIGATEIVAVGPDQRFAAAALRIPYLDRIVLRADKADDLRPGHPIRAAFASVTQSAALVCVGETCSLLVTEPSQIAEAVRGARGR
jgi:uncharacterized protein